MEFFGCFRSYQSAVRGSTRRLLTETIAPLRPPDRCAREPRELAWIVGVAHRAGAGRGFAGKIAGEPTLLSTRRSHEETEATA
jgi:hypothetical protein